jgi:dTDP-4-dehydrorhamnose reductase
MTILLLGATGMLGRELHRRLLAADLDVDAPTRHELDLTDADAIGTRIGSRKPTLILNAAAYTAVDKAETEQEAARVLNAEMPAQVAAAAKDVGAHLVHVSTDYVFPGDASAPYVEDDATGPLGVYGQTKLDGERAVLAALPSATIVRTAWVFGAEGNNFVKTMLRLMKERASLRVVADQRGRPTAAGDLADAMLALAGVGGGEAHPGIFHFCNEGETTWHAFASAILDDARRAGAELACRSVEAITTADYPTPARRPAYSVLSTDRYRAVTGRAPRPWREALGGVLGALLS